MKIQYPCPDCGKEARQDSTLGLVCANKACESYYLRFDEDYNEVNQ